MSYTKPGEILQRAATDRADARMRIQELEQKAQAARDDWASGFFRSLDSSTLKQAEEYERRAKVLKRLYEM